MEEKESTVSGSMSDSGPDSPSPVTSYSVAASVVAVASPPESAFNVNVTSVNAAGVGMVAAFSGSVTSAATNTTPPGTSAAAATGVMSVVGGMGPNGGDSSGKKRRGRPRKYDSDGNLIIRTPSGFSLSPASPTSTKSSSKKSRGKAFGSGNWSRLASIGELFGSTAGWDFTPHIVTVNTGEDVAGEILAFTRNGSCGICVLSANGAVSNVTVRQPGSSGGLLTYEGRFEVLSLTGSFVITETGGVRNKTGGLSVSLAGPDGRVIGGSVAGILTAASPIQIVIGSFLPFIPKPQKRKYERKLVSTSSIPSASSNAVAATTELVSHTKPANDSAFGRQQQQPQIPNASSFNPGWNGSEPEPNPVISPDINVSAPSE